MRFLLSALAVVLLAPSLAAQGVKLPAEVRGDPGAWLVIVPESKDGGEVKWRVGGGLSLVPIDRLFPGQKAAGIVVQGQKGRYEIWAWNAKGDVASDLAVCTVIIGDAPPGPTPPGPTPPEPTPSPAPIPAEGFRVLLVYESADLPKLPKQQLDVIYDTQKIRAYLDSKCIMGPDGKTREWRIWDQNLPTTGEPKIWQDAMARPRQLAVRVTKAGDWEMYHPATGTVVRTFARMEDAQKAAGNVLPWIIVSNGKSGYEGPLPQNIDDTLTLLKKYGG